MYRLERQHRMTEKVCSASLGTSNSVAEGGLVIGDSLSAFGGGRFGLAIKNLLAYCADGLVGGVCDGISAINDGPANIERSTTPANPQTPS